MKPAAKSKKASTGASAGAAELLHDRELRRIVGTVLRLAKSTGAQETEVHVDEVADALTRFANNAIHQNVAEHGLTVSIRTVVDGRTARATTNRIDEDSIRAAIEASLSLARSQPKDPRLLRMPGRQSYRAVKRFIKQTAALNAEERARAVRRACDLAVKKGQVAAGIYSNGQSQSALGNSRGLFAAYRETHSEFSITAQEDSAASWAKANSADVRAFDPQKLAARASEKAHLAVNARMMRSSMLEVAYEDFVTVARAKGLDEKVSIAVAAEYPELVRGIVANPDYWRLWQDLGFVYYWDLKDYARAARAFETGSERPGALPWMKAMAAAVAAKGGDLETSRLLWAEIYRHAENDQLRRAALDHLTALEAEEQVQ